MKERYDCVLPLEDNSAEREVCSGATLNNKDRHDKGLSKVRGLFWLWFERHEGANSSLWLDSVQTADWLDRAYVSYQEMNPSNTEHEIYKRNFRHLLLYEIF